MRQYREAALEGASGVDLVVALYDGIIRFLLVAAGACDEGDVEKRRAAARRAIDIVIHLQARLRLDIGGVPAESLAEFYASVFAGILRASAAASREQFFSVVRSVRNVREAWQQIAQDPAVRRVMPRDLQTDEERMGGAEMSMVYTETPREEGGWRA
jgi:flagellar protein FliS